MKILFNIDTEADFWKYIHSPLSTRSFLYRVKWRLNRIRGFFVYSKNRNGLINIVEFLKKYKIPATFFIVGHLYLKSCNGWPHFNEKKPKATWFFRKNWYYWDPASDYKKFPGLYLGDFIEKEMKNSLFDLGIHNFSHECLPFETKEIAESIIDSSIKSANLLGVKPISYCPPFNINSENSYLLRILRKKGIKILRYLGEEKTEKDKFKTKLYARKFAKPFKKQGLVFVWDTNYFDGTSSEEHMHSILRDIKKKLLEKDSDKKVYCLHCHDFTFRNSKNLRILFINLLKIKNSGEKIEFINMKNILNAV